MGRLMHIKHTPEVHDASKSMPCWEDSENIWKFLQKEEGDIIIHFMFLIIMIWKEGSFFTGKCFDPQRG